MPARRMELRPGWLIVDDLHVSTGAKYRTSEQHEAIEGQTLHGNWRNDKTVANVEEQKAVLRTKKRAYAEVRKLGYWMLAGTFVPLDKADELEAALIESNRIVAEYNAQAKFTHIRGSLIPIQVTSDNTIAAEAVWKRARQVLEEMTDAIDKLDVAKIRETLRSASNIETIFPAEQAEKITKAFKVCKKIAFNIKRKQAGKTNKLKELQAQIRNVDVARIMFIEATDFPEGPTISLPPISLGNIEIDELDADEVIEEGTDETEGRVVSQYTVVPESN